MIHFILKKRPSFFFLPMLYFLLTGCVDKDDLCCGLQQDRLVGKWRLVEQKVGIGPPGEWEDVTDGEILEFNSDYSFHKSQNPYCTTGSFSVDGDELTLDYNCLEYDVTWEFRVIEFKQSYITISPLAPTLCTEGCLSRYKKIE